MDIYVIFSIYVIQIYKYLIRMIFININYKIIRFININKILKIKVKVNIKYIYFGKIKIKNNLNINEFKHLWNSVANISLWSIQNWKYDKRY